MKAQKKNGYNANGQKKNGIFCIELSHEVDLWYDETNMTDVTELIKNFSFYFLWLNVCPSCINYFTN